MELERNNQREHIYANENFDSSPPPQIEILRDEGFIAGHAVRSSKDPSCYNSCWVKGALIVGIVFFAILTIVAGMGLFSTGAISQVMSPQVCFAFMVGGTILTAVMFVATLLVFCESDPEKERPLNDIMPKKPKPADPKNKGKANTDENISELPLTEEEIELNFDSIPVTPKSVNPPKTSIPKGIAKPGAPIPEQNGTAKPKAPNQKPAEDSSNGTPKPSAPAAFSGILGPLADFSGPLVILSKPKDFKHESTFKDGNWVPIGESPLGSKPEATSVLSKPEASSVLSGKPLPHGDLRDTDFNPAALKAAGIPVAVEETPGQLTEKPAQS